MKIKMPDDAIYELDLKLNSEQRLQLVNEITNKYNDYFNQYWEGKKNTNGNYTHKVKTTLDILGSYLFYGEEDNGILTERQIERRCGDIEIPVNFSNAEATENFINKYKEQTKKKKIQSNYHNSKTHRLTTLRIPIEKRKNRIVEDESKIHTHIFSLVNGNWIKNNNKNENDIRDLKYIDGQFKYKCIKDKEIKINVFTEKDDKLPFIPSSVLGEWLIVNSDNQFTYKGKQFIIKGIYNFDKILCYELDNGKKYFFDQNIKQVKDFSK